MTENLDIDPFRQRNVVQGIAKSLLPVDQVAQSIVGLQAALLSGMELAILAKEPFKLRILRHGMW